MGLPAHVSTGTAYDFDEEDEDRPGKGERPRDIRNGQRPASDAHLPPNLHPPAVKTKMPLRPCTFKRSIPCFFVPHVPSALPWYKEVLGFAVVGAVDPGRVELHRAHPRAPRGQGGVSLYLRKPLPTGGEVDPATIPKGSLWIEVDNVDGKWRFATVHPACMPCVCSPPAVSLCPVRRPLRRDVSQAREVRPGFDRLLPEASFRISQDSRQASEYGLEPKGGHGRRWLRQHYYLLPGPIALVNHVQANRGLRHTTVIHPSPLFPPCCISAFPA